MEKQAKRPRTKGNFDETLSPGEILLIQRRRNNWTQADAAKHYNLSTFCYKLAEYGKLKDFKYPKHKFTLLPWERCLLYRRRAKMTQAELADKIGISRVWVRQQEFGDVPCTTLLEYWEGR